MPILEDDDRLDRAVYWAAAGVDASGEPVFDEPIELRVNWRQRRTQTVSAAGSLMALDAQVTADRRLPLDSRLWLAPDATSDALAQWYSSGSAGQADEVMRVATQGEVRDAKGIETRYTAGLAWDRDV